MEKEKKNNLQAWHGQLIGSAILFPGGGAADFLSTEPVLSRPNLIILICFSPVKFHDDDEVDGHLNLWLCNGDWVGVVITYEIAYYY
jgi:hypothetical protein